MRIGIDASRYQASEATGVEWYSFHIINNLLKLLKKKKNEVSLYSREKIKFPPELSLMIRKERTRFRTVVLQAKRLWTLRRLSKEMRQNPPDVLFVPSHVLPLSLPKKSVIMIHDVAFRHLRSAYSFFQYHYLNWSTRFAVKHATSIIVPSEATKSDLMKFYKCPEQKAHVVPHGFEVAEVSDRKLDLVFKKSEMFRHFEIKQNSKFILFVGRLESKKNLVNLVKGFKRFSATHEDFRLILAGKRGVGFLEIVETVKALELFEKVIMPGYVTEEEKAALMKYCTFFAFPSLYEGFGFPILEAFHYGKPVLTSHVSSIVEVARDAAYYIDPYDSESIAMGLEKLASDMTYCKKLVTLGEERMKFFDWEVSAKKTLDVILK